MMRRSTSKRLRVLGHLSEDGIHDAGRPKNLRSRDGIGSILDDALVEKFHEFPHAIVHVKIIARELPHILNGIAGVFPGVRKGGKEVTQVTLLARRTEAEHGAIGIVEDQVSVGAIKPKLVGADAKLRGEKKERRGSRLIPERGAHFVHNVCLSPAAPARDC